MNSSLSLIPSEVTHLTDSPEKYPLYEKLSSSMLPPLEALLDKWLTPGDCPQKELVEAARYCVFSGGKRVRPLLLFATLDHYQPTIAQEAPSLQSTAIEIAACIELIHTYSLIHDDLPSMDDDDLRRGRKTLHTIIGEGPSILAGDFLLTLAFEKLSMIEMENPALLLKIIQTIARASGNQGMVGGQYLDITAHQHPHTKELLTWIHRKKTGALFTASVLSAALLMGIEQTCLHKWEKIGQEMGLLFQLIDDLIDSLPSNLTEPIPLGPSSYIAMAGSEKTWEEVQQLRQQIEKELIEICPDKDRGSALQDIVELICHRYEA